MNERLFRTQFNQMDTTEKQALMESLAARYDMTFLGLHTFDRWGQNCTTGIFKKDGREFVFVPGDTVTLGWEQFAVGLNQESREELEYLFREWEMEPQNPEEMIRESMAPVRQAAIGPMLVGRELEEINWEPVKMDDPRLTAHPDWLKEFRDFAWSDSSSLTLHQSARIERTEDGFQTWIYNRTDYDELLAMLENRGFSLPTADEWAYLCGGGCRTLFPWGDGLDYSMRLRWFEDMDEDENRPYDMEEPNFFGLSIAYDPYMREVVQADRLTTCGGDGGCNICGGLGPFLGFLPCSPHCKPEVQEDNELNGDYDFYRPIGITDTHIREIKEYLSALELIVNCPIETADPGAKSVEHILFTQPGMRYCQAQALVHSLMKDETFSALSELEKTQTAGRILEEVRGRMLEDIVLLETMKSADREHRVFKLQFAVGEFDMVIYDEKENCCEIFEIKHSGKQVPAQYRHLLDQEKCDKTEQRFGPIRGRYILYRGEDAALGNGVQYRNVERYLNDLPELNIAPAQEAGIEQTGPVL